MEDDLKILWNNLISIKSDVYVSEEINDKEVLKSRIQEDFIASYKADCKLWESIKEDSEYKYYVSILKVILRS